MSDRRRHREQHAACFGSRHIRFGGGICRDLDIDGRAWNLQHDAARRTRGGRQSKATLSRRSSEVAIFSLGEMVQENGYTVEKIFQSFRFVNTKTTFPIPFASDIRRRARWTTLSGR
ncbi:hypothetical protein [Bradyrhizobium retamae]|uniref:hypothetical protein n=1 Tax=Bradyrhizobium retamae TaxID=1300035 RepID=UPI0012E33F38|nr:hypothetical protein [Bradyrhizobium retamae]